MVKKNLLLLAIVVVLAIIPIIFLKDAEFGGADGEAEVAITEISAEYEPWFSSIWEPPSGEIESLLFVLQAAIGAGFIGYFIGFMRGRAKKGTTGFIMLSIDQYAHTNHLYSISATQKVIFSICALLTVWISRNLAITIWTFLCMTFLIVYIAKIPLRYFITLLLVPMSFCLIGVIAVMVSFTTTNDLPTQLVWSYNAQYFTVFISSNSLSEAFQLFYTAFGSLFCLYFGMLTTPIYEICELLRKIRLPEIVIELMLLTYHFIFLFLDCMRQIYLAQQTRLGYSTIKSSYQSLSLLIVALVREIFVRNQVMVAAMKARNIESLLIPSEYIKPKPFHKNIALLMSAYFCVALLLYLEELL